MANQIAAGEVVERPSSVVKELVENALDAGATDIRVAIETGGKVMIEVADDGSGMDRDDAVRSLDRHATSKIRAAADLVGIGTFGFRGEALPAIASVSRLTLTTSPGGDAGTEITIAGGRISGVRDVARRKGTTVTCRSIFFNTPARRKFLRSAASEARAVSDAVTTLALAHPGTGFTFTIDGKVKLSVPAGQERDARVAAVWGDELARTLLPVAHGVGPVRVIGFTQRPADARPTGRRVQLFVNGRPFRDHFLVRAAEAGYRSAIHPGDRPSLFLDILVDPSMVDVNVHPAKLEVRFRDRYAVERAVEEAIRLALGEVAAAAHMGGAGLPGAPRWLPRTDGRAELPDDLFAELEPAPGIDGEGEGLAREDLPAPWQRTVFQLADTWICYQSDDALIFVDQHSAHERVLYEEVMRKLTDGSAAAQQLLLPETMEFNDEELDAISRHEEEVRRIGYDVAPFGGRSVIIHAAPNPHPRFDALTCFRELVSDLAMGRFGGWVNGIERFAQTYACRAAVKAGQALDDRSMRELLARLFVCELPPHDVHGRATMVQLPITELERRFGRT